MRVLFLLCAAWCAAAQAARVQVDATTNVVLGDQPRISSRLFGVTAFEGFPRVVADPDYRARLLAIRPGCVRFPGNVGWCAPKTLDLAWYRTPAAWSAFTQTLLFGARYPIGRFLPIARGLGAEPMCSLGAPPAYLCYGKTRNPSDFDQWARLCAAYVGLWKRADPRFRLVQVWNEPNATWFRDPRAKGRGAAELHIEMADLVARAVKARFPDVLVGGPVLCWPPAWPPNQKNHPPWYTWDMWTRPWLKKTKDAIDFFDFHVYDVSPDDFAVQVEMTANEALRVQGRRLPIWITESNYRLSREERHDPAAVWRKRMLPYERFLLRGVLPHADKIAGNLWHDLHARAFALLPDGSDQPDPSYWLLWVLRDLRGLRVAADADDPHLIVRAAMEEDRVTVVLFNDSAERRAADLEVNMPCGYWTGPRIQAIGEDESGGCRRLTVRARFARRGGRAAGRIEMPPRATYALHFRMNAFGRPRRWRRVAEYFGDRTLLFLRAGERARVRIAAPGSEARARWSLRVGLLGAAGDERLAARFNGEPARVRPAAWQTIPLKAGAVRKANRFEIEALPPTANPRLALGFVSLVSEKDETWPRPENPR